MIPYQSKAKGRMVPGLGQTLEQNIPSDSFLLYVGDTAQLPPITPGVRESNWVPTLLRPTASLTTIHRQAEGNPIITIATDVRLGRGLGTFPNEGEDPRANLWTGHWATIDRAAMWLVSRRRNGDEATLLTWRNVTRVQLNRAVRMQLGHNDDLCVGDHICVRKNDKDVGLMNGEVAKLVAVHEMDPAPSAYHQQEKMSGPIKDRPPRVQNHRMFRAWLSDDRDDWVTIIPGLFEMGSTDFYLYCRAYRMWGKRLIHCTYGECLTVHASQGSEWGHTGIYIDGPMASHIQQADKGVNLYYTALTRAAEQVHVFWAAE